MPHQLKPEIIAILDAGQDLTLATLRPDGWPQATTVSYASEGLDIYFGCSAASQKAHNLARDDRVSLTVDLPYRSWDEIRGLSIAGRARPVTEPAEMSRVRQLFLAKFPQMASLAQPAELQLALFRIEPEVISVLDYRKGFGTTEQVRRAELG